MAIRLRRRRFGAKLTSPDGLPVVVFPPGWTSLVSINGLSATKGSLYRAQPNIKPVVDFIAEEAAVVPLKVFSKVPISGRETGRIEAEDHPMALLLDRPSPTTTRFRFWKDLVADYLIYDTAFVQKIRINGAIAALVRVPPSALMPERDPLTNALVRYRTAMGTVIDLNDLIVFHGYDPEVSDGEQSILDTLRRILAEEQAAGANREHMWKNATRKDGVIQRPLEAPVWDRIKREAFRADWEGIMSGDFNAHRVGILEDGMQWIETQWSPQEMEYLGARQMTRKQCAAVFRLDPRLVFSTDAAPDHEAWTGFYRGRLNSLLTRFQEEIDLQLLPELESQTELRYTYTKFNIEAKLRGSFEEQLKLLIMASGQAILAPNESRKILDYPPIPGFDSLTVPLNVLIGGQASAMSPTRTPGEDTTPGQTPGEGTIPQAASRTVTVSMTPEEAMLVRSLLRGEGKSDATPIMTSPGTTVNVQIAQPAPIPPVENQDATPDGGKPWHIEKQGDKYCVIKDSDGSVVPGGCHDTRSAAEDHMAALYASEADKAKEQRDELAGQFALFFRKYFERTGKHLASTFGAGNLPSEGTWVRWDRELAFDLASVFPDATKADLIATAHSINETTRDLLGFPHYDPLKLRSAYADRRAADLGDWFAAWLGPER